MPREVAGEGSYGCVHKPSIHCKTPPTPDFNYTKKVSKIMKKSDAEKELAEFVIIGNLDPDNDYHLGSPISCKPDLTEPGVKEDISKCKYIKLKDVEEHPDNYNLLILEHGGIDLSKLCEKHMAKFKSGRAQERVDYFLIEAHHLLKGLKFFRENGIVHNDLKPQNILFNFETGELRFIDFGLMRTKRQLIETSNNNTNFTGIFHWSYPLDCGFMNKKKYTRYKNLDVDEKDDLTFYLQEKLIGELNVRDKYNLNIKRPESFRLIFSYINPTGQVPTRSIIEGDLISFGDGLTYIVNDNSYDYFLNKVIDSIDIYGLGFSLQYIVNCFKRHQLISENDLTELTIFFRKMYDFNPETRETDIDILINTYESLLLKLGVLTRVGLRFKNNNITSSFSDSSKKSSSKTSLKSSLKSSSKSSSKLSKELKEFANEDPIIQKSKCPENKELILNTRRCVNKCKEGYKRNKKFKCVKTKKNLLKI